MSQARNRELQVSGTSLSITEWGPENATATVIFTHGWGMSSASWQDVAVALVEADPSLRVIAYDHRGHGQSGRVRAATLEVLADDLAVVVERLAPIGPIVFGGHSMGGMTVMVLAQRHPHLLHRVSGVGFVNSSAGDLLGAARRIPGAERAVSAAFRLISRARIPSWSSIFPLPDVPAVKRHSWRHDMRRVRWQSAQSVPAVVAALGLSMRDHRRYAQLVAFRNMNVVVLAGTRDFLTPPVHARRIAGWLPDSGVEIYRGAGHFLPYERSRSVTEHFLRLTRAAAHIHTEANLAVAQ